MHRSISTRLSRRALIDIATAKRFIEYALLVRQVPLRPLCLIFRRCVRGTFLAIFNNWPPQSGHRPASAPLFERFDDRFEPRTGAGGFEVWTPVKRG
jgi:hypothetical protein